MDILAIIISLVKENNKFMNTKLLPLHRQIMNYLLSFLFIVGVFWAWNQYIKDPPKPIIIQLQK